MFRVLLASLAMICALCSCVAAETKPEDTVQAFARALTAHDFKTMASLVAGGNTSFDYSQILQGDDQELEREYKSVTVTIKKVQQNGARATVFCEMAMDYGDDSSSRGAERVPLQLIRGEWKIVPYEKNSPTGYWIEEFANKLAHPEKVLERQNLYLAKTRNQTEAAKNLGVARTKFFSKVLDSDRDDGGIAPYNGYRSMTMVDHTTVYWRIGRADELVFEFSGDAGTYLTAWRDVGGKPKRIGQLKLTKGKSHRTETGTLGKMIAIDGLVLPRSVSKSMRQVLDRAEPFSAYIESAAISTFYCYVKFPDQHSVPKQPFDFDEVIGQDSYQLFRKGFYITPTELELIAARK